VTVVTALTWYWYMTRPCRVLFLIMAADATRRVEDVDVDQGDDVVRAGGKLTPFRKGDPRAAEAGRKGAAARRANRLALASSSAEVRRNLDELRGTLQRGDLGGNAAAGASWLIGQIVAGRIPVRNGEEAATLLRALVDVARLESGESTSNTLVAHVGAGAAAEVRALRDQARAAIGQGDVVDVDAARTPRL
jgi:hypothetical protein